MSSDSKFLAFDFGAESGRALLGIISDGKLTLEEIHRFPNASVRTLGCLHWDILRLFGEIKHGLKLALEKTEGKIDGIGVDTWGVDFGLFGEDGELLGNPAHYRDERTNGVPEKLFEKIAWKDVFAKTGLQFMQLNTLYQLYSLVLSDSTALKSASKLLMIPDIFNYWLTGKMVGEYTIASTSQCIDVSTGDWARDMLDELGIPSKIMPNLVKPGSKIGTLADTLVAELGMGAGVNVYAPGCHDTASAVAAVPATGDDHAYISSGTWSLMGIETSEPIVNEKAMEMHFTNEGGVAGKIRFLRNIMGLWLVQECRRTWLSQGHTVTYGELAEMATCSAGFQSIINPDDQVFLTPGDMPARIQKFCKDSGQKVPQTQGEIIRCALDSLAMAYRSTIESADVLMGKIHNTIHIVGGGTQNKLLCQLTADATGRTVVAGPIEATAIGNVLTQAMGAGMVQSLDEARAIVRNSFELHTFTPRGCAEIEQAYEKYKGFMA